MEASQGSGTGSSNTRVSSQALDDMVSADPATFPASSQKKSPQLDQQMGPQSTYRRPLISTFGWDVNSIIARSPNFHPVKRVHCTAPNAKAEIAIAEFERDGNPLIIHGWNRHPQWPKSLFHIDWLRKHGDQNPTVRNVHSWADSKITMGDFVKRLRESSAYATHDEQERLYGKDGECPKEWTEWLLHSGAIPEDFLFHGSNDFLKFLPEKAKVQTLMCYMGIGDTFTPFHKDLCASSGQNLMCFSEHGGSAFWFMTKSSAAPQVAAYFHKLGHEVDLETHVVTIEELEKAPFDVYIAEQHVGDLVLVPPRSCHQVVNKGGITIKTSWSRMCLSGLQTALWHELPIYHRVCRQEVYKVKSNIFHALQHFTELMEKLPEHGTGISYPTDNLKQLIGLFDDILIGEFSLSRDSMPHVSLEGTFADDLHCDFCGADIFQSFFECDSCIPTVNTAEVLLVGDGLILCPMCYVEGRTCLCENMEPVQCRPFSSLLEIRDRAVRAIQHVGSGFANLRGYLSEQPLQLLSEGDANTFEAACRLFRRRQIDRKVMRSCRSRSHQVPCPAAIYCKSCHTSKCYSHLLEMDSIHSVDAILLSELHDGDANWHRSHRNSSQQYHVVRGRVIEDEESGSPPITSHKLAYLAKTYTTCRAIAPEVTKHGWYDHFALTSSIPIVNNYATALVENFGDDDPDDTHAQGSPNGTEPAAQRSGSQVTGSENALCASPPAQLGGINEVQPPCQSDSLDNLDSRSIIVDEIFTKPSSGALQLGADTSIQTEHDTAIYSPLSTLCSSVAASQSMWLIQDDDALSELTELTDSPLLKPLVTLPITEPLNLTPSMGPSLPSPTPAVSSKMLRTKPGPKFIFDCVEIRPKRKRTTGPLLSDIAGPSDSDTLQTATPETPKRPLTKRKRISVRGRGRGRSSARLPRSTKRTHSPFSNPNPPLSDNIANALNQTFRLNNTSEKSADVPTTTLSPDAISPVISPLVQPQYVEFGVQKDLNFARRTATNQTSDPFGSCIMRLDAEKRELQAQVEKYKEECEKLRDGLDEIKMQYEASGSHHYWLHPSSNGPSSSAFDPHLHPEISTHHKWRTRDAVFDDAPVEEPDHDYPPIATLPAPSSSSQTVSASPSRRTPTEPRRMKARRDGRNGRVKPYYGHRRQYGRRRDQGQDHSPEYNNNNNNHGGGKRRPEFRGSRSSGPNGRRAGNPGPGLFSCFGPGPRTPPRYWLQFPEDYPDEDYHEDYHDEDQ